MDNTNISIEAVDGALRTAQHISDFGMSVVTAGFFLILSMVMMIIMFRWFKKLLDGIVDGQAKTMDNLLEETMATTATARS